MKRIFAVWAGRMTSPMSGGGPWGGSDDEGDRGKDGPRNPWTPPENNGSGGPGSRGPSAIDELIRRARNSFGGSGSGGSDGPSLRKLWPYAVLALVAIWILTTSIQRIGPQQRGLVTLFGSYVRTLGPGVNFVLPAPIESVNVVDVDEIRTIDLGSAGDESQKLMLTEDQNIINLGYSVRWNISNPEFYVFQIADPEKTIQQVAESAMRAVIATVSLQEAIGAGRNAIEQQVQEHMQTILDSYGAGIRIQGVAIKQADPPDAVNDAFKEVTAAQQAAQTYLNQAQAYAQQLDAQSQGAATAFDKVYAQYRLAPGVTRRRMYYEMMDQVLPNVNKTIIESKGVVPYLQLPSMLAAPSAAAPDSESTVSSSGSSSSDASTNSGGGDAK